MGLGMMHTQVVDLSCFCVMIPLTYCQSSGSGRASFLDGQRQGLDFSYNSLCVTPNTQPLSPVDCWRPQCLDSSWKTTTRPGV